MIALLSTGLIPLAWLGIYLNCLRLGRHGAPAPGRPFCFVLASAGWGAVLVLITETLSVPAALHRDALCVSWLGVNAITWGAWFRSGSRPGGWREVMVSELGWLMGLVRKPAAWPLDTRLMLLATLLLTVFLALIGLLTPTMNWDSLTYHLPRVMHWAQQSSVRHYPTDCISQLQMGPFSAFLQTHLFLLWGSDRLANLIQWAAMAGCAIVAPWVALQLAPSPGANSIRLQVLAALLVVTLPTGIVEAVTPQTDYVTAFWFIALVGVGLDWARGPSSLIHLVAAGCLLGLGLLTKITTVFWAFPFCVAGGLWLAAQWGTVAKIAGRTFLFMGVCLALVLPHFMRNFSLYGSPAGAQSSQVGAMNAPLSLSGALSNLIRNAALHANTGVRPLTQALSHLLGALHALTGRSLQDPATTLLPDSFQFPRELKITDSDAGNPYHLALILWAIGSIGLRPGQNRRLTVCAGLLTAGMALFCFLLRWQPWHSRYQLPFFVGFMPVAASVISSQWPRWAVGAAAGVVTGFGLVVIAENETRPIFNPAYLAQSRTGKMLYHYGPLFQENLATLAGDILRSGCTGVGLKFLSDDAEYPLWVLLRERTFTGRIDSVFVENDSAKLGSEGAHADVLVTMTGRVLPAESGARSPYCMEYGQVTACWSEKTSHWCDLAWFDTESQKSEPISTHPSVIPFRRRLIPLYFRSPRAVELRLTGTAVAGQGLPLQDHRIRAKVAAQSVEEISLTNGNMVLALPLPAGQGRVSLGLVEGLSAGASGRSNVCLTNFQWKFEPANH